MTVEWSPDDEIVLFKCLLKCRPLGLHTEFRMIDLYMRLNTELAAVPRLTMPTIRRKLESLYDMEYMQAQISNARGDSEEGNDDDDDDPDGAGRTAATQVSLSDFSLPYLEYHDLIEAQAAEDAESASGSPAQSKERDPRSSPAQSFKTESVLPEEDDEDGESVSASATVKESQTQHTPARRGRKRTAAGTVKGERDAVVSAPSKTSTPRGRKAGSARGSNAGTPQATDDESNTGSTTTRAAKTRSAPSRKSTRKK